MPYEPLWKYCTAEHVNDLLLSLRLFGDTDWPPEKQLACLYALSRHAERHYHPIELPKRDGSVRKILAPDPLLKTVQRNILRHILNEIPVSPHATAYRRGVSIVSNAIPHTGSALVLKLDIQDFFPSITYPSVAGSAFPATLYPPAARTLLTHLCCYMDALPQGAPTSPALSNLVMRPFDRYMGRWCAERGVAYTRYCDDMTFSGDFNATEVRKKAEGFLEAMGFTLNGKKTRILRRGQRQFVTGIVVNDKPQAFRVYRRRLRQELHFSEKFGVAPHIARIRGVKAESIGDEEQTRYLRSLLGRIGFVLQVNPEDAFFMQARERVLSLLSAPHTT